jgi:hypothetical protein
MQAIEELAGRLDRAERDGRIMFAAMLLQVLGGTAVLARQPAFTQPQPAIDSQAHGVTVKEPFRVVDESGQLVFEISVPKGRGGGQRVLRLIGKPGECEVALSASAGMSVLGFQGHKDEPIVGIVSLPGHESSLTFWNEHGEAARLGCTDKSGGSLTLHGTSGSVVFRRPANNSKR